MGRIFDFKDIDGLTVLELAMQLKISENDCSESSEYTSDVDTENFSDQDSSPDQSILDEDEGQVCEGGKNSSVISDDMENLLKIVQIKDEARSRKPREHVSLPCNSTSDMSRLDIIIKFIKEYIEQYRTFS